MNLYKSFLYFAVFKHPLTREEALKFCQYKTDSVDLALEELVQQKKLFIIDNFYSLQNNREWVTRRVKGNTTAEQSMGKARKMGRILSKFPFVRSVMISGSLSKGYMDEFSDIDFFVIMKPGNITISKLIMGVYERIFANNTFCVNFLIDSDHLEIKKQNLYTAIELATLIPIWDTQLYDSFIEVNKSWVQHYLPNYKKQTVTPEIMNHGITKRVLERLLSSSIAGYFNKWLIRFYKNRWKRRNKNYKKSLESGELELNEGVLKFHNGSYQEQILGIYETHQKNYSNSNLAFSKEYLYD